MKSRTITAVVLLACFCGRLCAQDGVTRLQPGIEPIGPSSSITLQELVDRAGLIFAGVVRKIDMTGGPQAPVRITFEVLDGMRGAHRGEVVSVQEWRGLWLAGGNQRFHTGERVVVFYHAPGESGLTSLVGGDAGRFPMTNQNRLPISPDRWQGLLLRAPRLRTLADARNDQDDAHRNGIAYKDFARAVRLVLSETR